jgi:hypothetical protein
MLPEHAGQLRNHRMIVGKRLGFELFQSTFYLCRVQFHARLLDWLGWLRTACGLTARGCCLRRIEASRVLDPDRSSPPAPRAGSQVSRSIREISELNPEQWCLFAPVQPGNEIKLAMFPTKPSLKQSEV